MPRRARSDASSAPRSRASGRLGRSTAFFSIATAASRVAGLVREIVAACYFGVSGPMSAFTIAFQVPNLVRSLFADAAIQAAFVPVFTEQLEQGAQARGVPPRLDADLPGHPRSSAALTALFILLAPVLMPLFVARLRRAGSPTSRSRSRSSSSRSWSCSASPGSSSAILNSYDRFAVFAISPFFWNVAIIAVLVGAGAGVPRGRPDLRLRDRRPRRHRAPAGDARLRPAQHAVRDPACAAAVRRLRRTGADRRAPRAAADAAGDDQPRADQLQPGDQQHRRLPRLRRRRRPRSTRRSGSTCCPRGSSRSR